MKGVIISRTGSLNGKIAPKESSLRGTIISVGTLKCTLLVNDIGDSQEGILLGKIHSIEKTLHGIVTSTRTLRCSASIPKTIFGPIYEDYTGDYTVSPIFAERVLPTRDKHMVSDLTIECIPYSEVTNTSGGLTINIGG